jgi:hypothetical protein
MYIYITAQKLIILSSTKTAFRHLSKTYRNKIETAFSGLYKLFELGLVIVALEYIVGPSVFFEFLLC